jgi:hypothetical protein
MNRWIHGSRPICQRHAFGRLSKQADAESAPSTLGTRPSASPMASIAILVPMPRVSTVGPWWIHTLFLPLQKGDSP